jgi:hypothetical protein
MSDNDESTLSPIPTDELSREKRLWKQLWYSNHKQITFKNYTKYYAVLMFNTKIATVKKANANIALNGLGFGGEKETETISCVFTLTPRGTPSRIPHAGGHNMAIQTPQELAGRYKRRTVRRYGQSRMSTLYVRFFNYSNWMRYNEKKIKYDTGYCPDGIQILDLKTISGYNIIINLTDTDMPRIRLSEVEIEELKAAKKAQKTTMWRR